MIRLIGLLRLLKRLKLKKIKKEVKSQRSQSYATIVVFFDLLIFGYIALPMQIPQHLHSLVTLVLILTPLFIGFILPLNDTLNAWSERLLNYLVYLILLLIGIEMAQVAGLGSQIGKIILYVGVLSALTIGAGLVSLMIFDRLSPWTPKGKNSIASYQVSIRGSLLQVSCVAVGFVIGKGLPAYWLPPDDSMTALLMLLILLVGISLKASGITLKEVILSKRGMQTSVIFTLSVLMSGAIFAMLFNEVSLTQGLALSSGFGWYSLSAIVMTDAYGAIWGSVALFNDLVREFFALMFIPLIMRRYPSAAVGVGGATSLDFTLPIIQQSGGVGVVPLAISYGFIINIVSPILMVGFTALGR